MSVANILGADGKIKGLFLPASDISGGLTNPLTTDLQCGGFEVQQASYVRTNIVECETLEPKSPQTFVECVGDFSVAPTKVLDVDTIGVDVLEARTGSVITALDAFDVSGGYVAADEFRVREGAVEGKITYNASINEIKLTPAPNSAAGSVSIQQDGGARPSLNFYDISGNTFGNLFLEAANAIRMDSDLRILKANPALRLDDGGSVATIRHSAGFNEIILQPRNSAGGASVSIQQAGGAQPRLGFFNVATSHNGNFTLVAPNNISSDSTLSMLNRSIVFVGTSTPPAPAPSASVEYVTANNAITIRPAPSTVSGSLNVVTSGGALPSFNLINSATGSVASMTATATRLEVNQNVDVTSTDGRVIVKEIEIKPAASGKLIFPGTGLTVTDTLPTFANDSFITLTINGVDYQLALKRA